MNKAKRGSYRSYRKGCGFSYTWGAFPTFELLTARPGSAKIVFCRPGFSGSEKLRALCAGNHIPFAVDEKVFAHIGAQQGCQAAGVFVPWEQPLNPDAPHIVLIHPEDMGNLGTVIRTMLGFGIYDLAVVTPAADLFHPKTVRASMGAIFRVREERFSSFEDYRRKFHQHDLFPFLPDGELRLTPDRCPSSARFSLIFGNEASGLPPLFRTVGRGIAIPQSDEVDSLNLAVSAAIGIYLFSVSNGLMEKKKPIDG